MGYTFDRADLWAVRDDRTLSAHAKLAYLMLWSRSPNVHPSIPLLAADMNCSVRKAQMAVRELETAGLLKVIERKAPHGDRDSNGYELMPLPHGQGVVQDVHHPGESCAPPVVQDMHPKNYTSTSEQPKGQNGMASRRAHEGKLRERGCPSRDEVIAVTREAISLVYGDRESIITDDEEVLDLYGRYVAANGKRVVDPAAFLVKIFEDTPDLATLLQNAAGSEQAAEGLAAIGLGEYGRTA